MGSHSYNQDQDTSTMKEKLEKILFAITDSWLFVLVVWAGIISLIIWKPMILVWFLAGMGLYAIISIIAAGPLIK